MTRDVDGINAKMIITRQEITHQIAPHMPAGAQVQRQVALLQGHKTHRHKRLLQLFRSTQVLIDRIVEVLKLCQSG